jgi:hypothetical protein
VPFQNSRRIETTQNSNPIETTQNSKPIKTTQNSKPIKTTGEVILSPLPEWSLPLNAHFPPV